MDLTGPGGAGTAYHRLTTGSGLGAVTIIQFKNVQDNFVTNPQFSAMNFQIILEGTGVIRMRYGTFTPTVAGTASLFAASVGLKGDATPAVNVRSVSKGSGTAWASATGSTSATTSFSVIRTTLPVSGQQYSFTPEPKARHYGYAAGIDGRGTGHGRCDHSACEHTADGHHGNVDDQ